MSTKSSTPPKNIGIVIKHKVPKALEAAISVADWLEKKKCTVIVADESKDFLKKRKKTASCSKEQLPAQTDLIIVFGGDGTFLSIARQMIWKSVPILGVNLGQLGFLTEILLDEVYDTLTDILKGKIKIQERSMLEACVKRDGKELFCLPVLNDVVVTKSAIARVIDFQLYLNKVPIARLKADGLIASTPTGSTAYSLAAGGPIVHPQVGATIITAICPHSLNIRPLVIPEKADIEIELLQKDGDIMLTLDGQFGYELHLGDLITISKYKKHSLKIVQSPKRDYFELLRSKLYLGARG
ncbi:MAG: NAD(+)/NADH kinase [Oligoflexia bacterium]|nr:NAD(+)/NADH kinase [Oligoflexia bacterium]